MTRKIAAIALLSATLLCAATRNVKSQTRNMDCSDAASVQPRRGGTVLPLMYQTAPGKAAIGTLASAGCGYTQGVTSAGAGQRRNLTESLSLAGVVRTRVSAEGALQKLRYGKPACTAVTPAMLCHTQADTAIEDDIEVCALHERVIFGTRSILVV
jgi:hypothetical protein